MIKTVIIGAGSGFGGRLSVDIMSKYNLEPRQVGDKPRNVREWMKDTDTAVGKQSAGKLRRSQEYTTGIMEAKLTDVPYRFNGNVMNTGLLTLLGAIPRGFLIRRELPT